ncbi:Glycine N-methyltransferase [Cryptotermes secundus]|nr:Glycine N-methyltransferase [Cryptotermes secundus]
MLLEEGFKVTSVDASDKMLKYALKARWNRRKEEAFDNWVIDEANWLTLPNDIAEILGDGFDAVICLGNSFSHMPDTTGDRQNQRLALKNFEQCVKPGGLLLIDHRNYDHILQSGHTPSKCIYYNSQHMTDIRTSVLYVNGQPSIVIMDYMIDASPNSDQNLSSVVEKNEEESVSQFRLSYYPQKLAEFSEMLEETFGSKCKHTIYGDFKLLQQIDIPDFYIHVMEKLT